MLTAATMAATARLQLPADGLPPWKFKIEVRKNEKIGSQEKCQRKKEEIEAGK